MPFTAQELDNIASAALDYHMRGAALAQAKQERPLYDAMSKGNKTFPGGKENITVNVKGEYSTSLQGYSHDDTVTYTNPANIKRASYPWKELHAGISVTLTELKVDGVSVVDSNTGEETSEHSERELTAITNLLEDKLDDMSEGSARSFNEILWRDGSQSSKVFPGIQSIISLTPQQGVTGGIDRASNTWWRNRARVGTGTGADGAKISSSPANQTLTKTLRSEVRLLRRYGGKPSLVLCGSGFLEKLEAEIHEKGIYTQEGFVNNGKTDIGMANITMRGVGQFMYDPTLDDLGFTNFSYFIDPRRLYLKPMEGEEWKSHAPSRPPEKYVIYRATTYTGGLVAEQLNCHGVYEAA